MSVNSMGLVGLGVMGSALSRNLSANHFSVVNFSISASEREHFLASNPGAAVVDSLAQLVAELDAPRCILLMVTAGTPVDDVITQLLPMLSRGDIIIDGGNSYFKDTQRRQALVQAAGLELIGAGISGGEEGALTGASIMIGGSDVACQSVAPMLQSIAALVDGQPCAARVGKAAAGHFVKMVHNGIEYGMMQLIAECVDLLRRGYGCDVETVQQIFARWQDGPLAGFLVEVTRDVLAQQDDLAGGFLVEHILDVAGQKGTGRWTSELAIELGHPVPTIIAAVTERQLSALKPVRIEGAARLGGVSAMAMPEHFVADLEQALYGGFLVTFAQGLSLINVASVEYDWQVDVESVLKVWRGGCIIRSALLAGLLEAHAESAANVLFSNALSDPLETLQPAWRRVLSGAVLTGVPVPALGVSLAYLDSLRSAVLPTSVIQAQRDYFGAHTYERVDRSGTFHTEWQRGRR